MIGLGFLFIQLLFFGDEKLCLCGNPESCNSQFMNIAGSATGILAILTTYGGDLMVRMFKFFVGLRFLMSSHEFLLRMIIFGRLHGPSKNVAIKVMVVRTKQFF